MFAFKLKSKGGPFTDWGIFGLACESLALYWDQENLVDGDEATADALRWCSLVLDVLLSEVMSAKSLRAEKVN
jgi:hypothetical protein